VEALGRITIRGPSKQQSGGVLVCCLSGARCRPARYFLFQIISFKKYFYVSLGNNFKTVFLRRPLSCGGLWATAQFALPLKSGPGRPLLPPPGAVAGVVH